MYCIVAKHFISYKTLASSDAEQAGLFLNWPQTGFHVTRMLLIELHHEKTCLRGLRPGNQPAQLQKLATVFKFQL